MMKLKFVSYIFVIVSLVSCSLEKGYLSPFSNTIVYQGFMGSSTTVNDFDIQEKSEVINYSSEISNDISSFPKVSNEGINQEVDRLKTQVKDYIYALQEYNIVAKNKALDGVEVSYKKIQRLRKNLKPDEDLLINRYLVKIKGNITKLESLDKSNTVSPHY